MAAKTQDPQAKNLKIRRGVWAKSGKKETPKKIKNIRKKNISPSTPAKTQSPPIRSTNFVLSII